MVDCKISPTLRKKSAERACEHDENRRELKKRYTYTISEICYLELLSRWGEANTQYNSGSIRSLSTLLSLAMRASQCHAMKIPLAVGIVAQYHYMRYSNTTVNF